MLAGREAATMMWIKRRHFKPTGDAQIEVKGVGGCGESDGVLSMVNMMIHVVRAGGKVSLDLLL